MAFFCFITNNVSTEIGDFKKTLVISDPLKQYDISIQFSMQKYFSSIVHTISDEIESGIF